MGYIPHGVYTPWGIYPMVYIVTDHRTFVVSGSSHLPITRAQGSVRKKKHTCAFSSYRSRPQTYPPGSSAESRPNRGCPCPAPRLARAACPKRPAWAPLCWGSSPVRWCPTYSLGTWSCPKGPPNIDSSDRAPGETISVPENIRKNP